MWSISVLVIICIFWFFAAKLIDSELILPQFLDVVKEFFTEWTTPRTLEQLGITMYRVLMGTIYGVVLGTLIGLIMGYSPKVARALSPIVNSVRQIPIMAWVPLSIVWFGLGEGPTVFMIFMAAVFPLIINTVHGVTAIDPNYINAARSMGASTLAIYRDVIIPGAMPSFLTGLRLAISSGWMSVICAEFIATSSGFGYLMIEAQHRLWTPKLYALMIMAAIVGFVMDQLIRLLERRVTRWRFKDGKANS